jgi:Holliday junction resolvasome RuvABC endonuclease subunit
MGVKEFDGHLKSNQEITIGIDQSLTGFALSAVSVATPTEHLTKVYKSPFKGVQRLVDIRNWLDGELEDLLFKGHNIVDIAMEGTVLASHSALVLGELSATVKLVLWDFFEDYRKTPLQIPPMTLKKYATGKGTAKKQEMLLQMYKRWGVEFNDDNAADSYALARLAGGHGISAFETQIIEQIKDPKYRDTTA